MGFSGVISTTSPKSSAYDVSARGFFIAQSDAGVTLTDTQKNATNQLVIDLKAAGLWNKMKAVYPMVGGTATSHKFNLITPADTNAAFRLQFFGGGTHSANGYLPNGVDAYADTFLIPSSSLILNSTHFSFYSRTNANPGGLFFGAVNTVQGVALQASVYGTNNGSIFDCYNSTVGQGRLLGSNVADSKGFAVFSRSASNSSKIFWNNALNGSITTSGGALPNTYKISLSARNTDGVIGNYDIRECAFASIGDGLTDLESQLFYQITEKYQVALGRNVNATQSFYYNAAYNNETNAFLFSTQITDNTIQTATNTLVSDLKTAGVFTKMKAIYPMVGGTATTHKFNLVNAQDTDAAFRLSFVGGGTHSSNGYQPNGTNGYADTFLTPSTSLSLNNSHLSLYNRTNVTSYFNATKIDPSITTQISMAMVSSTTNYGSRFMDDTYNVVSSPNALGFYIGNRTLSTQKKYYKNGVLGGAFNVNSIALPDSLLRIGVIVGNGYIVYSSGQCAFASIGDGLTDAEALALYNAVQLFNTTLGRQV